MIRNFGKLIVVTTVGLFLMISVSGAALELAPIFIKRIFNIIHKINVENKTTIFRVEQYANMALKSAQRG